jgi:hypothetical protein
VLKARSSEQIDVTTVRLSEVLSALSVLSFVLDMVEGQPEGRVLRSCFIGMTIAKRLQLSEEQRSALFYALLLKDAGCSSNASKVTALFGADDFGARKSFKTVNWSRLPQAVMYVARNVSPEGAIWTKARRFLTASLKGPKAARELVKIRCERGAEIPRQIGFLEETAGAIRNLDEHWNGAGHPEGLEGEEIPLLARIRGLAQTVEVFILPSVLSVRKRWFTPAAKSGSTPRSSTSSLPRPGQAGSGRTWASRTSRARVPSWNRQTAWS